MISSAIDHIRLDHCSRAVCLSSSPFTASYTLHLRTNAMSSRLLQEYPTLATYSEEQLKDLLTNDELLDAFLYSLPAVQGVLEHQQQLSKANDELASEYTRLQVPSRWLSETNSFCRKEFGTARRFDRAACGDCFCVFDRAASQRPMERGRAETSRAV